MSPGAFLGAVVLALGVLQGERPQLDASVDEDRVAVGEDLTYTLRAESHSPMPMQVTLAPFTGLEVVARSERTEVGVGAGPTRTTIVEYRLRAVRPGHWQLGPARAVQGRDTVEAGAIVVDVSADRAATASTLSPQLRRLLEGASPPSQGQPSVDLLVSSDTVRVGEQVDVVTAAWFPRDLRLQLRRPPTLQPPVIDGVWSFPQSTPTGIAATRLVRGRWYDLFVSHQVVFPLVAGMVVIPRAALKYSTPVALQFFSQEERYALTSRADTLIVRPLPEAGRPAGFAGAIGSRFSMDRRVDPAIAIVGEGVAVELRLTGEGNTALWPTPELAWTGAGRAYLERVDEQVTSATGRIGGTKTFRFLVVPDSAGALALPGVRYPYFDLAADRYADVVLGPVSVPVAGRGETVASAALPPALLHDDSPAIAWTVAHAVPDVVWTLLLVLPPLLLLGRSRWPMRRVPRAAREPPPAAGDLRAAEAALDDLVRALAPEPGHRFGPALAAAARAAGADAQLASRVASVRERLLARRYGPDEQQADDPALAAEAHEVVRRLGGSLRGWQVRGIAVAVALCTLAGLKELRAQSPAAEQLYESGALRAAADGFARRVKDDPAVAASWYNLGAAYYRLGARGRAEAAWLEARRLAPRASTIRRALVLAPPADIASSRWTWSPPVTPEELLLMGAAGWILGWFGWTLRPRLRDRWVVLLVFAGGFIVGGLALRRWYRRPVAIVLDDTTLRLSPHGRAPDVAPVEGGSAVRVVGLTPGWMLVRAAGGRTGWVPNGAVARVGG